MAIRRNIAVVAGEYLDIGLGLRGIKRLDHIGVDPRFDRILRRVGEGDDLPRANLHLQGGQGQLEMRFVAVQSKRSGQPTGVLHSPRPVLAADNAHDLAPRQHTSGSSVAG